MNITRNQRPMKKIKINYINSCLSENNITEFKNKKYKISKFEDKIIVYETYEISK